MSKFYDTIINILKLVINILFVLQITLMILVFFTATYWLFNLLNITAFDFAQPIAMAVSDFVKLFYNQEVEIGGLYIDSSLLLFDLIAIAVVYGIAKFKYHIHKAIDSVIISKKKCMAELEAEFNKQLQKEAEASILKCNNVAILVQFDAKNMFIDSCWGGDKEDGVQEKIDEAFKVFYGAIKNIEGCRFAKTGNKMLIMLNDFNKVDNLLHFIDTSVNRIRENMRAKHWSIFSFISVDVYDNKTNFKTSVYPNLERLIALHHKNEAVCLGNFVMRYKLLKEQLFNPFMRGTYNLDGECEVWTLVKKN